MRDLARFLSCSKLFDGYLYEFRQGSTLCTGATWVIAEIGATRYTARYLILGIMLAAHLG